MEYHDLLQRYVGRWVCVSTFGQVKLRGRLASLSEDCLRLVATSFVTDGEDSWYYAHASYQGEEAGVGHGETLIHFQHVVAITCLDDQLPEVVPPTARIHEPSPSTPAVVYADAEPFFDDDVASYLHNDRFEVQIGRGLVSMFQESHDDNLVERISQLRKQLGMQLGFPPPRIRIRDNYGFEREEYRIFLHGGEVARGQLRLDRFMAIPGKKMKRVVEGERGWDPVHGIATVWITPEQRAQAEGAGYYVVEPVTLILAHVQKELRLRASDLLSLDALRQLVEATRRTSPAVVEEALSNRLSLGRLHELCVSLLEEQVPLHPFELILEKVATVDHQQLSPLDLESHVRKGLARTVCQRFRRADGVLPAYTFDAALLAITGRLLQGDSELEAAGGWAHWIDGLASWYLPQREQHGEFPLLIEQSSWRRRLWQMASPVIKGFAVLSIDELPHDQPLDLVCTLTARKLDLEFGRTPRKPRGSKRKSPAESPPTQPR